MDPDKQWCDCSYRGLTCGTDPSHEYYDAAFSSLCQYLNVTPMFMHRGLASHLSFMNPDLTASRAGFEKITKGPRDNRSVIKCPRILSGFDPILRHSELQVE